MTRILLVDDHPVVRQGIKQVLSGAFSPAVVGEAANAEEGLTEVRSTEWDVLVLDLTLPGVSGIDLLKDLRRERPPQSWRWAGDGWERKPPSKRVGTLSGVEIAARDADAMAARWAEVLDLRAAREHDGARELSLVGTLMYKYEDFSRAVDLMAAGRVITEPLDSNHFAFEDYPGAYRFIDEAGDRSMKVFIDL
jgi:CheY-like chemotaxis protein